MISLARFSGSAPGQVDLVEDRDDLEPGLHGQKEIREGLGLHPLRRIDDEDRPFARGERPAHLVGEVDVARRVDQVELVGLAVARGVGHAHGVELDGDAALALQVHRVEDLFAHLALVERARGLDEPVGQGGLAVVNVGDDTEISDAGL